MTNNIVFQGHNYQVYRTGGVGLVVRRKRDGADCMVAGDDASELEETLERVSLWPAAVDRVCGGFSDILRRT